MANPSWILFSRHQAGLLAAVCTMMWGVYCVYGLPATLSVFIQTQLDLDRAQYTWLVSAMYSAFSLPNVVLPLCSGFAVQRFGRRAVLLTASACVFCGQSMFALAISARSVWLIILGRFTLGLGGEVMGVLAYDVATVWFADSYLSLALSIFLAVARSGSFVDFLITPRLVESFGIVTAAWAVTVISLGVTGIGLSVVTRKLPQEHDVSSRVMNTTEAIQRLSKTYWYLILICVFGYGTYNTFNNSIQRFLAARYFHGSQTLAGSAASVTYVLSSVLVVPFGLLLELPWFRISQALLVSFIVLVAVHAAFLLRILGSLLPLTFLGMAYALYGTAFWAALAKSFVLPSAVSSDRSEDRVGLMNLDESPDVTQGMDASSADEHNTLAAVGFGLATSILNLTVAVVPILLAVLENIGGYTMLELFFIAFAGLGCMASVNLAYSERLK